MTGKRGKRVRLDLIFSGEPELHQILEGGATSQRTTHGTARASLAFVIGPIFLALYEWTSKGAIARRTAAVQRPMRMLPDIPRPRRLAPMCSCTPSTRSRQTSELTRIKRRAGLTRTRSEDPLQRLWRKRDERRRERAITLPPTHGGQRAGHVCSMDGRSRSPAGT
ncbi:hypothetical protein OH77DRAFT_265751 [Trametes cingulata]|nr:hypothetical protein OH77DRAFT_265751 [Trametes cingulata]